MTKSVLIIDFGSQYTHLIGRKIRDAETNKIPIMLIIGEKEAESKTMAVRRQGHGDVGIMNLEEFINYFNKEAEN